MVHLATILSTTAVVASLVPSIVVAVPIQASASEDGLVEREPFLPLLGLAASAVGSIFKSRRRKRDLEDDELIARFDTEDLSERNPEPFLPLLGLAAGALFGGRKRDLSADDLELITRLNNDELSELVQRNPEPFLPLLGLAASAVGSIFRGRRKRDLGDLTSEDLDLISRAEPEDLAELMSRNPEPFLPLLGLAAGALFGGRKRELSSADYEGVFGREFAELENLEMREYDEDEMIARSWSQLEELD
jgi:hypothetical protein